MYLIEDKNGKKCLAKTCFLITFISVIGKYTLEGFFSIPSFDSGAAVALLTTTGALYFGRSHTKDV